MLRYLVNLETSAYERSRYSRIMRPIMLADAIAMRLLSVSSDENPRTIRSPCRIGRARCAARSSTTFPIVAT